MDECTEGKETERSAQMVLDPPKSQEDIEISVPDVAKYGITAHQMGPLKVKGTTLTTQRQSHNALRPVNRLSTDLFLDILEMILGSWARRRPSDYHSRLYTLKSVSTQWRRLVDSSPSLWGYVSSSDSLQTVKAALEKSKDSPLDVSATSVRPRVTMTEFMDLVLPHVHRWRYLYLSQSRQAGGVLTRLSACYTPQLQQLCLFTHGFLAIEDLFRGKADRLRHVQLHATSLPWDSSIMCDLQTLELEDLQSGGPSAEQIVSILRASPGLVKLSLKSINSAAYLASNIHPVEPLELPSLNHLVISKLSVQATNHILSNLQFPSLHALVAESESATVFLGTQSMYLHCRKLHGTVLSITVDVEHWPMDFAERLLRHIHHANASLDLNVTIDPDLRGPHLTKVINLLPILCHTRTLLLQRRRRGGLNNSNAFIRQLATPQAFDGVLRWLLPQLEILTFNNVQITDEILDLVEQRYKLVGSDDLGTPEAPLSRLKSLKFAGGERALQRLTFVLGEGVVKPL